MGVSYHVGLGYGPGGATVHGEAEYSGVVIDGRYLVQRRLGQGGMGTVYAAEHVGLGQRRAIKFLRKEVGRKAGAIRRFLQEARVLSGLQHEHVVTVLDMGEYAGTAYYVMELLEGEDLRGRLRRLGALPWADVRAAALQVCAALRVTHDRGIVHRDLKPENCFCVRQPDDAPLKIKLIDFGVAKVPKEAGGTSQLTGTGEALGTVGYMAPEQMEGQGDLRVDVYSLGAMIFELLAGRPLYRGNAYEVISRMLLGTPPLLRAVCPEAAPEIEALISQAIDRDPERRFATMTEFAAAISAIPADAPPTRGPERLCTEHAGTLAVDGEATTFRDGASDTTDPGNSIDGEASTMRPASDLGLPIHALVSVATEPREPMVAAVVPADPNIAVVPRRRAWLVGGGALAVGLAAFAVVYRSTPDVGADAPVVDPPGPAPEFTPSPVIPAPQPTTLPPEPTPAEPPPEPIPGPPAPPEPALGKPQPAEVRLTREQLKRRVERELRTCKPDLLDETVAIRATPGKTGALEVLAPVSDGRLAPGIADCVERGLSRVLQVSKEPLAVKKSFDISVVLRKPGVK